MRCSKGGAALAHTRIAPAVRDKVIEMALNCSEPSMRDFAPCLYIGKGQERSGAFNASNALTWLQRT